MIFGSKSKNLFDNNASKQRNFINKEMSLWLAMLTLNQSFWTLLEGLSSIKQAPVESAKVHCEGKQRNSLHQVVVEIVCSQRTNKVHERSMDIK